MSDKSKKPVSGHPEKLTASKKKTTIKTTKDLSRATTNTDNRTTEQMIQQAQSDNPLTPMDKGTVGHEVSLHTGKCGGKDKSEPNILEPFATSPNIDEATTSSPVLSRSGSSLLRIRAQIRHAKSVESKDALRTASETEDTAESDADSGDTNTSLDASTRSIGGSRMLLNELPRHANEILQRAKTELEKSGNLKREIRESVVSGLYTLYEMILKFSDSRMLHMLESNKQKLNVSRESERLTQRHARFMHETLGQYALLKENIEKLQKETESARLILSYDLCEVVNATKRELVNLKNEISTGPSIISQMQLLRDELRQLQENMSNRRDLNRQDLDVSVLVKEMRELRSTFDELISKKEIYPPPEYREELAESTKTSEHLLHQITEIKTQLSSEVKELRQNILVMSQNVQGLMTNHSNFSLPSVQASIEELRKDTKELRDTTVDSAAPIRVAIEGLRKELKTMSQIEEAEQISYNTQLTEDILHTSESKQQPLTVKQKNSSLTYSEVVRKPHYPIIVESIDPRCTSDDIIKEIKSGIDVVALGIGISNVKKAKNQKVLISCESEEDRNILQNNLKNTTAKLTVHKLTAKNPLLRLIGVIFDLTDKKIEEAIIKQNSSLLKDISPAQQYLRVVRRMKGRTSSTCNVVLEVSSQIWTKFRNQKIRVGFQIVPAVDQSPIIQCFRCLGFSHRARECQAQRINCGYCAEAHDTRECHNRNMAPKCINCIDKKGNDPNCSHPAYSPECVEWRKWDRIARSTISYC
ncbi:unnamed protein product [Parnassius mnemosyne]|uniref:Gag-like protein n=1 Tax=Parnassius mnemosyne TaxID=213953 RepID=A0AAV1L9F3_9NEOP